MPDLHLKHWPAGLGHSLPLPDQSIPQNLIDTASRTPDAVAIHYYGNTITYGALLGMVRALAGWLQSHGVVHGDRVLLHMQNAPQYVIGYYAIQYAGAVVIPVNPMNRRAELIHLAQDTDARIALVGSELLEHMAPLLDLGLLDHIVPAAYADLADPDSDTPMPDGLAGLTDAGLAATGITPWQQAIAAAPPPAPHRATPDDLAVICYSSGTTGQPKGCMHTHRNAMATTCAYVAWGAMQASDVLLAVLPFFHVSGMQNTMNAGIRAGASIVIMSRWDRDIAALLLARHRVTIWRSISTMAIDLVNSPDFETYDLSSLRSIGGGGAAMPAAIAARMNKRTGLGYIEGYGLSETISASHMNPPQWAREQCLGIPLFDVDSRVLNLETGAECGVDEEGEIVIHGPQVMQGYWRNPEATAEAFIDIDGKRFLRSGDIGRYDADGYYFMTDRVKRMINASGFKVWPAEVEMLMHRHPDIAEACVIGAPDPRRGETVKAYVVALPGARHRLSEQSVIDWCHGEMAAYKCPRSVAFIDALPKSGSGKVLWNDLTKQDAEASKARA